MMRTLTAITAVTLLAATATPVAQADGIINVTEATYIANYGEVLICDTLDGTPTPAMVAGLLQAVMDDGFTGDSAVDVINSTVANLCPDHWPLLVRTGEIARGEFQAAAMGGRIS
jgi:hypothetical protein